MMYRWAALALAGTVGLLVLFAVGPYKALLEERMGWRPSESPARALSEATDGGGPVCSGEFCNRISIEDLDNGGFRISKAPYDPDYHMLTLTLPGPGYVTTLRASMDPEYDYLDFFGTELTGDCYYYSRQDIQVPEGPQPVFWTSDEMNHRQGWSFDFIPSSTTDGGGPSCIEGDCELLSIEDLDNGGSRISRGPYGPNEAALLMLPGPGVVTSIWADLEAGEDKLWFSKEFFVSGYNYCSYHHWEDIRVPEGPQQVVWSTYQEFSDNGWRFDFIPDPATATTTTTTTTTALSLKLKLKVKGKSHLKALMKVKVVNGKVEAKGKVKETHRRRRG